MARSIYFLAVILLVYVHYLVQNASAQETSRLTYKPQQRSTTTVKPKWNLLTKKTTMKPNNWLTKSFENPNWIWLTKQTTMKPNGNDWLTKQTTMKPYWNDWLPKRTTMKPIWNDWLPNQRSTTTMKPNWNYISTDSTPSFVYIISIVIPILIVALIAYACYKQYKNKPTPVPPRLRTTPVQRQQVTPTRPENRAATPDHRNRRYIFAMPPVNREVPNEQYPEDQPPPYPNESPPSYDQINYPSAPFQENVYGTLDKPISFSKLPL